MSPPKEYTCPHCQAAQTLPNARAFATTRCPQCGANWRPRAEIGGYRLLEPLVRSGLAIIFHAITPATGELVAVKVIRPPSGCELSDLDCFAEDVRILAGLDHPHWVRVFAGGIEDDVAWLAMEWLPQGSLSDLLAGRGCLSESETLQFGLQAASALAAARLAGLRHRHLQADNFLLADAQTLKLAGFAEAIFYERVAVEVGTVWGRLCCAPPERVFGEAEDVRSEIYALGATLFQALTGALPYDGETLMEIFYERLIGPSPHVADCAASVHPSTAAIIDRMLAIEPADRFQTWGEVLDQLGQALDSFAQKGTRTRAVTAPSARAAAQPAKRPASGGAWWTIVMLAVIAGITGGAIWKKTRAPDQAPATMVPSIIAAATPQPVTPVPAAVAEPPPAVPIEERKTPVVPPAPAAFDWSAWKTIKLESPKRRGTRGEAFFPSNGALRLTGNNSGVGGTHDENVFHARRLPGDWTLSARLTTWGNTAGLAVREGEGSESPAFTVFAGSDGKLSSGIRLQPNVRTTVTALGPASKPLWLKLSRRGATITADSSANGREWTAVGAFSPPAPPARVLVGFVVWSGAKDKIVGTTFSEIALTLAE